MHNLRGNDGVDGDHLWRNTLYMHVIYTFCYRIRVRQKEGAIRSLKA